MVVADKGWTPGGEHTVQCTDDALLNHVLETRRILLTSITPNEFNEKGEKIKSETVKINYAVLRSLCTDFALCKVKNKHLLPPLPTHLAHTLSQAPFYCAVFIVPHWFSSVTFLSTAPRISNWVLAPPLQ